MKKIIFIVSFFFSIITFFGQNGLKNGNLFLLSTKDNAISINSFEKNKINEIKLFSISQKSIYTTDQKERVAILDTSKNEVAIFDVHSSKQIKLSIPFEIKPKTVLLNQDNLFIGGELGKEILIQYNLQNEKWYQLNIPKEVLFFGKAIDDLVVNDSLLIAIDNIVTPKYILYYQLNSFDKLSFSHFKELKSNSSYENIHQARITNEYLGLFSTTLNHGNVMEHITLYADLDLVYSFAISVKYKRKRNINDFLLIGNKLFIANRSKGLGVFKIKKSYFKKGNYDFDTFNYNIEENLVKYKKYRNEEIIQFTKIPYESKIVLTIKNNKSEIRNEIINVK
jgi:hypothetical protein